MSAYLKEGSAEKKAAYFDMVEYFCNGHNDTAVDVIEYDQEGTVISKETFSWSSGCGEVTSEGIWKKADTYAQRLRTAPTALLKLVNIANPAVTGLFPFLLYDFVL